MTDASSRGEEAFDGDVLVDVGPVDADAAADEAPIGFLGWGSGSETREPGEGSGDSAAVGEAELEG